MLKSCVDFNLQQVLKNGADVYYIQESLDNGIRIKIGEGHKPLARGTYTYDIFYTTNRQLGFFDTHDELYWNVTGNGWLFPIDNVKATLHLPSGALLKSVEAYTGSYGAKGTDYEARINAHEATWQTKSPLAQGEGITIVATWPKGVITVPTLSYSWYRFIFDNLAYLILWLGLLICLGYAFYAYTVLSKKNEQGIIIPLFFPPGNLSPAQTRYLIEYGYDNKALAAELIDMAVHGVITIEKKKSYVSSHYEIKRLDAIPQELLDKYHSILTCLFGKSPVISLTQSNGDTIESTNTALKNQLLIGMGQYLDHRDEHIAALVCIGFMTAALYFLSGGLLDHPLVWISVVAYCGAFIFVWNQIKCYTPRGKKLFNEVEGFKLFLKTDQERLHFTSTPPIRTPELYEKYLPYAVALDVEEQWTAQFASVFEELKQQGTPYINRWYLHDVHRLHYHTGGGAPTKLGSRLGHSISTKAPGSSSGAGGRGSSGGGGGGGGGGAW